MAIPHVKIVFRLEQDEDGYPPVATEGLWAVPLGEDRYKIDNIPFYVRGIADGDVVFARLDVDKQLIFTEVSERSGHSTVRVFVRDADDKEFFRSELKKLGCESEGSNVPKLFAVDIPPAVPYKNVEKRLIDWESSGKLEYEEGCVY